MFSYVDLVLDLWVDIKGKQTILDEDEFNQMKLDPGVRDKALFALEELMKYFLDKFNPAE